MQQTTLWLSLRSLEIKSLLDRKMLVCKVFCDTPKDRTDRNKDREICIKAFWEIISKSTHEIEIPPKNVIICPKRDKWLKTKVKAIALSILNELLICIDSQLCGVSRPQSTPLRSAFYSPFGVAGCFHNACSDKRSTAHASEFHLRTPTTTFPSTSLPFCL